MSQISTKSLLADSVKDLGFYKPNSLQTRMIKSVTGKPVQFYEDKNKAYTLKNIHGGKLLNKSLTTGYGVSPSSQLGGAATRLQSMDPKIVNLTYGENDFTIYPKLISNGVKQANSTVEEYVVFTKHGQIGHSLFQHEIGIADISQPDLRQKTVYMKFLSATRQESFAAQIVNSIEDADRINELDALTTMGKTIEWGIFYGNSHLTARPGEQGVEFDGLTQLTDPRNFINARGHSLTPELLNKSAILIARGFGTPTDAYMPVGIKADFNNQFLGAQRITMSTRDGLTAGTNVDRFISTRGTIALHGSTVMDLDKILDPEATVRPKAPATPAIQSINTAAKQGGKFNKTQPDKNVAGSYLIGEVGQKLNYRVVASSSEGDSAPSEIQSAKVNNPDDGVQLTIRLAGRNKADYVSIYRQGLIHGDYWLIARVPLSARGKDQMIHFTDRNNIMPETGDVFVGEVTPNVIGLMQLLPMTRLNLAQVTDASTFTLLWYGALALYIPRRFAIIRNVRYNQYSSNTQNHMVGVNDEGYNEVNGINADGSAQH